jgi:cytoskeleton protein RodZ
MDVLAVGTISTALKQAREHQGTSLQDIAQVVKVPVRYLKALEGEGDRRLLADTMYLIPFLRTYATCLGFDPNGAIRQFISELQTSDVTQATTVKSRLESPLSPARFSAWIVPLVAVLGGLLMLAFVLRFSELGTWWPFGQQEEVSSAVFPSDELIAPTAEEDALRGSQENALTERDGQAEQNEQEEQSEQVEQQEETTLVLAAAQGETPRTLQPEAGAGGEVPPPALPSALPATASSTASALALQASQIPQVPSGLHQLRVHAVEKTWLRVVIDGEQTKDMMLSPDQQVQWEARSNFTLTVGNAGGIEVALDGNPLPPLGRSGEVVRRVRIPSVE